MALSLAKKLRDLVNSPGHRQFKKKVHVALFETNTAVGRMFDIIILGMIILSIVIVIFETVPSIQQQYRSALIFLEWVLTIAFTAEYILRIYTANFRWRYIKSFYGIVDLISVIPTYLGLFIVGSHSMSIVRALRLLRVFRIFKLTKYLSQGEMIVSALKESRTKISIFMFFIMLMVCIFGSLMYIIEGNANSGFDSIPRGIYWAIVTLTTVGYGDISPTTTLGQLMASIIMISGYAVLAVPTGIVSAEMVKVVEDNKPSIECTRCGEPDNVEHARYCLRCGERLGSDGINNT